MCTPRVYTSMLTSQPLVDATGCGFTRGSRTRFPKDLCSLAQIARQKLRYSVRSENPRLRRPGRDAAASGEQGGAARSRLCAQGCLAAWGTASRGADPSHRGARTLRNGLRLALRSRATAAAPNAVHADGV